MAYLKPQSPIKNGEDNIYPLTTYDQIIMADGSRWNGVVSETTAVGSINGKTGEVTLVASDIGAAAVDHDHEYPVTTVNGKTGDVVLTAKDVNAASASDVSSLQDKIGDTSVSDQINAAIAAVDFPVDSVNGKTGVVTLVASDVGAAESSHTHAYVPTSRKVNNKELSGDITLTASDVGAAETNHTHNGMYTTSNLQFSLSGTTLTITTS